MIRRFATEAVQFHFCPTCSALTHAIFADTDSNRSVAVVRVALFESIRTAAPAPLTTNFDEETLAAGKQRRLDKWTPIQRF